MITSGKTIDKKFVLKGVGKFQDSIGLPLSFIFIEFENNNFVIDWIDYIEYSIEKNWNIHNTLSSISEALFEKECKDHILKMLRFYLLKKFNLQL